MRIVAWPAFANKDWNPYNSLLYSSIKAQGAEVLEFDGRLFSNLDGVDIFHLHWPDLFLKRRFWLQAVLACANLLIILKRARRAGARVVWTAHNLQSHENLYPILERLFWFLFVRELDGVISMSKGGLELVRERRLEGREIPGAIIPHGHYRDVYPNQTNKVASRNRLDIDILTFVAGQFGLIRRYKGLQELLQAWNRWGGPVEGKDLLIAGHTSDTTLGDFITMQAASDQSIRYHQGTIDAKDLQYYFNACDVIVLPYQKILNSGAALLALSFNKPVVLPRSEVLTELQEQVGDDWVYLYEGEFNEDVLEKACLWTKQGPGTQIAPLDEFEWPLLAEKTTTFFQTLI